MPVNLTTSFDGMAFPSSKVSPELNTFLTKESMIPSAQTRMEKKLRFLADGETTKDDTPPKFDPEEIIDHLHDLEDGTVEVVPEGHGNYTDGHSNQDEDGYITINQAKFKNRDFWN